MACSAPGCSNAATMQCPSCQQLGIVDGSYFCSQDCFVRSWDTHSAQLCGRPRCPPAPAAPRRQSVYVSATDRSPQRVMLQCSLQWCTNEATMQCPTCQQLGLYEGSHFCSQDCFVRAWDQHQFLHQPQLQRQQQQQQQRGDGGEGLVARARRNSMMRMQHGGGGGGGRRRRSSFAMQLASAQHGGALPAVGETDEAHFPGAGPVGGGGGGRQRRGSYLATIKKRRSTLSETLLEGINEFNKSQLSVLPSIGADAGAPAPKGDVAAVVEAAYQRGVRGHSARQEGKSRPNEQRFEARALRKMGSDKLLTKDKFDEPCLTKAAANKCVKELIKALGVFLKNHVDAGAKRTVKGLLGSWLLYKGLCNASGLVEKAFDKLQKLCIKEINKLEKRLENSYFRRHKIGHNLLDISVDHFPVDVGQAAFLGNISVRQDTSGSVVCPAALDFDIGYTIFLLICGIVYEPWYRHRIKEVLRGFAESVDDVPIMGFTDTQEHTETIIDSRMDPGAPRSSYHLGVLKSIVTFEDKQMLMDGLKAMQSKIGKPVHMVDTAKGGLIVVYVIQSGSKWGQLFDQQRSHAGAAGKLRVLRNDTSINHQLQDFWHEVDQTMKDPTVRNTAAKMCVEVEVRLRRGSAPAEARGLRQDEHASIKASEGLDLVYGYGWVLLVCAHAVQKMATSAVASAVGPSGGKLRVPLIKSRERMFRRFETEYFGCAAPRDAMNVDMVRCSATFEDPAALRQGYDALVKRLGIPLQVDNTMHPEFDAVRQANGLRRIVCIFKFVSDQRVWGDLFDRLNPEVLNQIKTECTNNGHVRWPHVERGLAALRHDPVQMLFEVELMLRPYLELRLETHIPKLVTASSKWSDVHSNVTVRLGTTGD